MTGFIDLTHKFDANMPVYPGDPLPVLTQVARLEADGYNDFCLCGGMHIGTHMDAPLHMIADGGRIAAIEPARFFGRGVLVDARNSLTIEAALLDNIALAAGDIVIILTGWYKKFHDSDYYGPFPDVSPEFAERLVAAGVSILALDTPSPDRAPYPVHKILLGAGVLIIENLANVGALVGLGSFNVTALPAKFDWEAAPVRVIAQPAR